MSNRSLAKYTYLAWVCRRLRDLPCFMAFFRLISRLQNGFLLYKGMSEALPIWIEVEALPFI